MHDSRCTYEQFDLDDYDSSVKVLSSRYVKKTRKPWQCNICGKTLPAGTSKNVQYAVCDNEFYTFNWCTTNCINGEYNNALQ